MPNDLQRGVVYDLNLNLTIHWEYNINLKIPKNTDIW